MFHGTSMPVTSVRGDPGLRRTAEGPAVADGADPLADRVGVAVGAGVGAVSGAEDSQAASRAATGATAAPCSTARRVGWGSSRGSAGMSPWDLTGPNRAGAVRARP